MLQAGFAREIITPPQGILLDGYFNDRPNTGVIDDIYVKVVLFHDGDNISGVVTYDLESLVPEFCAALERRLLDGGCPWAGNLIHHAVHSHTAPGWSVKPGDDYFPLLLQQTESCIRQARENMREATLSFAMKKDNPFAFNRRYFMKNGKVLTNPGRLNPDIVRPEGQVDTAVSVLAVLDTTGTVIGMLNNISNHTDTIGGNRVSADWPGRLERHIQQNLHRDIPVLTLVSPAGNINHVDVSDPRLPEDVEDAVRLGRGYGKIVLELLKELLPLHQFLPLKTSVAQIDLIRRTISADELTGARKTIAELKDSRATHDVTSEDLINNTPAIRLIMAEKTVDFAAKHSGQPIHVELRCLKFGTALAIIGLPGEPFAEVGIAIRNASPFPATMLMGMTMGIQPYIPLKECYARGGYEPTILNCGLEPGMAEMLIDKTIKLLQY